MPGATALASSHSGRRRAEKSPLPAPSTARSSACSSRWTPSAQLRADEPGIPSGSGRMPAPKTAGTICMVLDPMMATDTKRTIAEGHALPLEARARNVVAGPFDHESRHMTARRHVCQRRSGGTRGLTATSGTLDNFQIILNATTNPCRIRRAPSRSRHRRAGRGARGASASSRCTRCWARIWRWSTPSSRG